MSNEGLRKNYDIYTDCWKLFKEFSNPPECDRTKNNAVENEFWENFSVKATELYKKHSRSKFVQEIIAATMDEIDRISKGRVMERYKPPKEFVEPEGLEPILSKEDVK